MLARLYNCVLVQVHNCTNVQFYAISTKLAAMATINPYRSLERIVRGFSSHRRIQILELLDQADEPLSLGQIAEACRSTIHPTCEHVRRLYAAGLIDKASRGRQVFHDLTPMGKKAVACLRLLKQ